MNKLQREADSDEFGSSNPSNKKKYYVVKGSSSNELEMNIVQHLNAGWICQGGVAVLMLLPGSHIYYQAMIKN